MNKLIKIFAVASVVSIHANALSLQAIFDNQKKAAFPDTCEMHIRTTAPGKRCWIRPSCWGPYR